MSEQFDVVIVGAGISGIAAGHELQRRCPQRSFVILESRDAVGGTWDLFRFPGVRSDSDMFTLGYSFRPWTSEQAIAPGPAIREYVRDTARACGLEPRIRFRQRVTAAHWRSEMARWSVAVDTPEGERTLACRFLFFCSGYYDYAQGHDPGWPGREDFRGMVVHPQHWPQGLDVAGKRVVVIGSGATAITLVPELARTAAHVTMLQRSPSYIVALPGRDRIGAALQRWLPAGAAYRLVRWKNILAALALYRIARRRPEGFRRWLLAQQRRMLPGFDVDQHLTPRYAPWDQRLCIAPDGDIFRALNEGRASIATDTIERFTPGGIRLASGQELAADVVVSATGLQLELLGGARITVDGAVVNLGERVSYQGVMCSGVPNLAITIGYTNQSWTLRAELVAGYVCRLLRYMGRRGLATCTPVHEHPDSATRVALDLSSGYIRRSATLLPRQGEDSPWRIRQNYLRELFTLRYAPLANPALRFGRAPESPPATALSRSGTIAP